MLTQVIRFSLELNKKMAGPTGKKVGNKIAKFFVASVWTMAFMFAGTIVLLSSPYRILYNATWSMDKGIYLLDKSQRHSFERGEMVSFNYVAPKWVRERNWTHLDETINMSKILVGVPGDTLIADGSGWLWVCQPERSACDPAGWRYPTDRNGIKWPETKPVRVLGDDEYLPLGVTAGSYDGRYFGPIHVSAINGVIAPVWTRSIPAAIKNPETLTVGDLPPYKLPEKPQPKAKNELLAEAHSALIDFASN